MTVRLSSSAIDDRLMSLATVGILLGTPRSTARQQHLMLPITEIECRREDIPNEEAFRTVTEHSGHILWRVSIDDGHLAKTFEASDWLSFISHIQRDAARHSLTLHIDRSVPYSDKALDLVEAFCDTASIRAQLDCDHVSWKTARIQSLLKSLKLPHVFLDGPHLPGIVKDVSYGVGKQAVLRCVGRNSRSWFEHSIDDRFAYSYDYSDLEAIAQRVRALKDDFDRVNVIFCNRPANIAAENVRQLLLLLTD